MVNHERVQYANLDSEHDSEIIVEGNQHSIGLPVMIKGNFIGSLLCLLLFTTSGYGLLLSKKVSNMTRFPLTKLEVLVE